MNNLPTSITTVRPKLPVITTNPISIESVNSSVQNLIKSWNRRQRWQHLFSTPREQDLNKAKWRTQLAKFIESTPLHTIAITLLLLDLVLTILELSKSLISSHCTRERKNVEQVWYNWIGIAILGLLSLKSMALAVAMGGAFFRRPGYVVDGLVVVVALCLEAFLERKGGGLLVVASLWRVVRVVESAFELSDEAIEAQIEGIVWQFEAIREENIKLLEIIVEKDEIIDKLKEELENCRM